MPAVSPSPQTPAVSALVGTIASASDVAGQTDVPLEDQLVLVIPAGSAARILDLGGEPLSPETLRFLHVEVSSPVEGVSTIRTGAGGSFRLPLDPGDYVLCLADAGSSADFPASTRGCGQVTVPAGQEKTIEISSGFGEILIQEP